MTKRRHGSVYRLDPDGASRVHVMAEKCATCIFRPGNLMSLEPGRVKDMLDTCEAQDGTIPCHQTLGGMQNVCRGFYEQRERDRKSPSLQIAERLGFLAFDGEPNGSTSH